MSEDTSVTKALLDVAESLRELSTQFATIIVGLAGEQNPTETAEGSVPATTKATRTRRSKKEVEASKEPTVTITEVQAALKNLAAAAAPDDSVKGRQWGRQQALDVLAEFKVDSAPKLEVSEYKAVIDACNTRIEELTASAEDGEGDDELF